MIRTAARSGLVVGLLLSLGIAGCGEGPTGGGTPIPGEMVATLASPAGGDASALLEVVSGNVLSVASEDADLLVVRVATEPVRIVAMRGTPGSITFRIRTDDVTHPPELRVLDVGGPDDALRPTLGGYAVLLVRELGS